MSFQDNLEKLQEHALSLQVSHNADLERLHATISHLSSDNRRLKMKLHQMTTMYKQILTKNTLPKPELSVKSLVNNVVEQDRGCSECDAFCLSVGEELGDHSVRSCMNEFTRHKSVKKQSSDYNTPNGFWDLKFPNTQ